MAERSATTPDTAHVERLRRAVKGDVIGPADAAYDDARRVWLSGIDRRPALIVRAADSADVARVVSMAAHENVELAVRSGGHSFCGYGTTDGGWVLDLSAMNALDIDQERRTAWAETGLTAGEYTAAVGAHGFATPLGDSPSVGLGGLTLGGGLGFLHRQLGLTIDNVLAVEVVTAAGELLHVDDTSHPELFWAIRGGGGNFGVVTRFQYRLHDVTDVYGGMIMLPADGDTLARFIAELLRAPDRMAGVVAVMKAPPMPMVPPEYHGRPVIFGMLVHIGDRAAGERAFLPLRALATPIVDALQPMRYPQLFEAHEGPEHTAIAFRSFFMDRFERADADIILDRLMNWDAKTAAVQIRVLGGAVAAMPSGATAFAHRRRGMFVGLVSSYEEPAQGARHEEWVDAFTAELRQGEPAALCNFMTPGPGRAREAYPGSTWERMVAVKRRYDPDNLFRLNVNVAP